MKKLSCEAVLSHLPARRGRNFEALFRGRQFPLGALGEGRVRVYLRSQKCWNIRQKAPDARRMSAALLCGMQANATRQMGLFGRIEQRWGVFRYTLEGHCGLIQPASSAKQTAQQGHEGGADEGDTAAGHKLFYPQFVGTGPFFQILCGVVFPSKSMGSFLIRCNSSHSRRRCVKSYSVFGFRR